MTFERCIPAIIMAVVGILLTVARRWNNKDSAAGEAIAGWTVFGVIFLLWLAFVVKTV